MLVVRNMWRHGLIHSNTTRFIPMMVTRMIISLKKAASSRQLYLDLEVRTGSPAAPQRSHSSRAAEGVRLSVLRSGQV